MYHYWKKKSGEEIKEIVFNALDKNVKFTGLHALGVPASYLDEKVFNQDASFLAEAPFLTTLLQNPNHIGCHTLGISESFFSGTQQIERELIEICAVDILKGEPQQQDGYVASGGTEANIQAIWLYRNYFINEEGAKPEEIAIICSADSHYSMDKAANLLSLDIYKVPVTENERKINEQAVTQTLAKAESAGKKHFIVISNMMTTMFGSVDNVEAYTNVLTANKLSFKLHIDGAYGGFYYPFLDENSLLTFNSPHISSFTLDAHKMAQAPYGTGIFLIRKGLIQHANTKQATYVAGEDYTLIGSRSGANAIATWMILVKNGPFGWQEKLHILQKRTEWMCKQLSELNVGYYRNEHANIITIRSEFLTTEIAQYFGLVPDNHAKPKFYKIVVMEHVTIEKLLELLNQMKTQLQQA